jgi:hypothetical protein
MLDPEPGPFTVVRLDASAPAPLQLALQACAGLRNRDSGGSIYVDSAPHDAVWLSELGLVPEATVDSDGFLASCLEALPCVTYDYAAQQPLLPNILTVASVLGALPIDTASGLSCTDTAFDAVAELADRDTPALATRFVFDRFGAETTGLAMLNPGYETAPADPASPSITGDMRSALVDFVFSRRLFVVFLVNGCIGGDPDNEVLSSVVDSGLWPTPLGVYGYNNSWLVAGGYVYEAQTRCLESRSMGAIPTEVGNLSFFSTRGAPITESHVVTQNEPEPIEYDPTRTYVAFVVGDGDNIAYIASTRHDWFERRVEECESGSAPCPPLTWSLSPHLPSLAPDLLRWYYAQSHRTGHDYFALPPSGHLYSYPSSLAPDVQERFATATGRDACILGLSGVVHWDWTGTWRTAEGSFLPRYARAGGPIRGVFPVNVPYLIEAFTWWGDDEYTRVLEGTGGGRVALFRPRSWRGVNNDENPFFYSPARMAEELSSYPPGTVSWVYMTSDGGLTLENSFLALVPLLPERVQLVSTETAARLAIAASQR